MLRPDCIHHHQINHLAADVIHQLTPGKRGVSNASDSAAPLTHLIDFSEVHAVKTSGGERGAQLRPKMDVHRSDGSGSGLTHLLIRPERGCHEFGDLRQYRIVSRYLALTTMCPGCSLDRYRAQRRLRLAHRQPCHGKCIRDDPLHLRNPQTKYFDL
jgi:hypothetical protein